MGAAYNKFKYEDDKASGDGEWMKWDTKGAEIEGVFKGLTPSTKYASKVGTIETDDGTVVRFSVSSLLEDKLQRNEVQVGVGCRIVYEGDAMGNKGQKYKTFTVQRRIPA